MSPPLESLDQWVAMLETANFPVFAATQAELRVMRSEPASDLSPARLAAVVLRDPLLALNLLRHVQRTRSLSRFSDVGITTVGHALTMLGLEAFFRRFGEQPVIEDTLGADERAIAEIRALLLRCWYAAAYAFDWARLRRITEPQELQGAALLHGAADMLAMCYAPERARAVSNAMRTDPAQPRERAERQSYGFPLRELQIELSHEWNISGLRGTPADEDHSLNIWVNVVDMAIDTAARTLRPRDPASTGEDTLAIAELIRVPTREVQPRLARTTAPLAEAAARYGLAPPLAEQSAE